MTRAGENGKFCGAAKRRAATPALMHLAGVPEDIGSGEGGGRRVAVAAPRPPRAPH